MLAIGMAAMLYLFSLLIQGELETEHKVEFGLLTVMMVAVLYRQFGGGQKEQMMGDVYLKEAHFQHNAERFNWSELSLTEYRGEKDYLLLYTLADAKHRYWFLSVKEDALLKALQERPLEKRTFTNCRRLIVSRDSGVYQIQAKAANHFLTYNLDTGKYSEGKIEGEAQKDYSPEFYVADPKVS